MATTGADPVFVDTNILIYANVTAAPEHLTAQARLQDLAKLGAELWVSKQVFREYLAALTRPQTFTKPIAPADLIIDIQRFENQFRVAERRRLGMHCVILGHHPTVATATIHVDRRLLQRHDGGGGNQTDRHVVKFR